MKHLLLTTDNFRSVDLEEYKYALVLEPISLIPVKDRWNMNKQVIIRARRHDRGALLTNDIAKALELIKLYGGYVYDMINIKKVMHNTKGESLNEWVTDSQASPHPSIYFGVTPDNKHIVYQASKFDYSLIIKNIQQLKGDLS